MRLVGVDIPDNKVIFIALTYIYGIGLCLSRKLCNLADINPNTLVKKLNNDSINKISSIINEAFTVEGDLRKKLSMDIRLLIDIGCYRGKRHYNKLPTRGQRTRTNARTRKGKSIAITNKKKLK
ncbi:MAG: 30S ribosomal protein S13 [Rickettsiaceae bacterium H1]|nr:30S ribosomal protein S13 [Rickettsiaceae bacterium H1]